MLIEDDESLTLTADPRRSANIRRTLSVIAAVCVVFGGWSLLHPAIAGLDGAAIHGAELDGGMIGGILLGLICWFFAFLCVRGARRFRQVEKRGLILQVVEDAVITASGRISASELQDARLRWRRFPLRTRHPLTRLLERWTGAGAHRTIIFTRTDNSAETVDISLFATDEEFARVTDRLIRMLTEHGIPVKRMA